MGVIVSSFAASNLTSFFPAERSYRLLRDHLSPAQREDYDKNCSFSVTGSDTKTRYRIRVGFQMNISVEEVGDLSKLPFGCDLKSNTRLCFGPTGVPAGDILLAQKVMLECDETESLRVAVKHNARMVW